MNTSRHSTDWGPAQSIDAPSPRSGTSSTGSQPPRNKDRQTGNKRSQALGRRGEDLAAEHLQARGYRLRERNVRLENGEIDIVAEDGEVLVFVEVRTRRGHGRGLPEESIDERKQQKLRLLVDQYHQTRAIPEGPSRIDAVVIDVARDGRVTRIELIENAVDG